MFDSDLVRGSTNKGYENDKSLSLKHLTVGTMAKLEIMTLRWAWR